MRAANVAHKVASPEDVSVSVFAFCCFFGLGGAAPAKTIVSTGIGFALASIGMDKISGAVRVTCDLPMPIKGVSFLVAVIGRFGIGELIATMEEKLEDQGIMARVSPGVVLKVFVPPRLFSVALIRSSLVGLLDGDDAERAMVNRDTAENAFRQSMITSTRSLGMIWSNALVGTLMTLARILLPWLLMGRAFAKWTAARARHGNDRFGPGLDNVSRKARARALAPLDRVFRIILNPAIVRRSKISPEACPVRAFPQHLGRCVRAETMIQTTCVAS